MSSIDHPAMDPIFEVMNDEQLSGGARDRGHVRKQAGQRSGWTMCRDDAGLEAGRARACGSLQEFQPFLDCAGTIGEADQGIGPAGFVRSERAGDRAHRGRSLPAWPAVRVALHCASDEAQEIGVHDMMVSAALGGVVRCMGQSTILHSEGAALLIPARPELSDQVAALLRTEYIRDQ